VFIYVRKSPWRGCTRRIRICGGVLHRHPIIIHELVNLAKDNPYPIIIGGDFDLLRYTQDWREVTMVGRKFTWANILPEPTYEKLDQVVMDSTGNLSSL
jgi:hypothetical protein